MGHLLNKQNCKKSFFATYCATRLAVACMLWGGGLAVSCTVCRQDRGGHDVYCI